MSTLLFLLAIVGVPYSAVVGEETDHRHLLRHSRNGRQNAENPSNPNSTRELNTGVLREGQFAPLSCNDNLTVEDCSSTITLSSILNSTPEGSEALIECGTCAMVDETDGSTLVFQSGLNIEGMLYFPSSAKVTLELDHLFVQGTLKMDAPLVGNSVTFFMTGTEDKSLYPHPDNSDACDSVDGCSMGKRAIAVAGGTLDISGLSEDKPCPSWTRLSIPSSDYSAIEVGQEAAECWEEIIDSIEDPAEILITNSEKIQGWNNHHVHQVSSIDTETGTLHLKTPVEGSPVTAEIDQMYAAEVALLNRRIIFDSISDGIDDLHGGHLIIFGTPGVAQKLEGVEVRNFGQQGELGRYPIHFHMSDSVSGSSVRKNVIRQSNQRCVVIHGSHAIMVENNVAYDTRGHCYILEDGAEMENTFKDNLGAMTRRQKHGIGSTDHKPATFWVTNTKNHYIGNIAAGSAFSGFWFETMPVRGASAKLEDNKDIFPKFLPMYTFEDNTSHSSAKFGLNTYEFGYRGRGTMTNTKLYKNSIGLFFHGTSGVLFDGGLIADNGVGIMNFGNFPPGNRMRNTKVIGTSAMYRDSVCPKGTGMLFSLNGRDQQLVLRNTAFEGYNYDSAIACEENTNLVLRLHGGFNSYPYDMPVFESDVTFDSNENVFDITHDFFPPQKPWNTFLEDPNGSMNPTGLPGFFVQDDPRMTTFVEDGACSEVDRDGSFAQFCKETCMRRVFINTGCCSEKEANRQLDPDYSLVVTSVADPRKSFEFSKYTMKSGMWFGNTKFDFLLPGGEYTLEFINPDGEIELPFTVDITFDALPPACDGYVTKTSFEIITPEEPTLSPDQFYSSGIVVYYYYNFVAQSLPIGGLLNSSDQHNKTQTVSTIDFTGEYLGNSGRNENVAAACEGTLRFREVGNYEICTSSDDGSKVYFDGKLFLNNDGLHPANPPKCRSIYISSPTSKATVVDFFQQGGGFELRLWWTTPSNGGRVIIPASAWMPELPSCEPCDDVETPWMRNNGGDCTESNLIDSKCNKDATWTSKKYCQHSCYAAGYGYTGDNCCIPPTPAPTIPDGCTDCDNTATPWMTRNGQECPTTDLISSKCMDNATWKRHKYCQQSCYDAGRGYDEDICCDASN